MTEIYNPVENPEQWQRFCEQMAQEAVDCMETQRLIADKWMLLRFASIEAEKSKKPEGKP